MLNFPGLRGPADVRGGGPHARAPGSCQRKRERHGEVLPQPPTHLALTLHKSAAPSSTRAGDKAESSVQEESGPYKGRARKTSNHSDLNELRSSSGFRVCFDQVYVVSLFGIFFFFFCHKDRMKSEPVVLHQMMSRDFSKCEAANFKWGEKWWHCFHLLKDPNFVFIFKSGLLAHVVIHSVSLSND